MRNRFLVILHLLIEPLKTTWNDRIKGFSTLHSSSEETTHSMGTPGELTKLINPLNE